jgi:hypothetical protein
VIGKDAPAPFPRPTVNEVGMNLPIVVS